MERSAPKSIRSSSLKELHCKVVIAHWASNPRGELKYSYMGEEPVDKWEEPVGIGEEPVGMEEEPVALDMLPQTLL